MDRGSGELFFDMDPYRDSAEDVAAASGASTSESHCKQAAIAMVNRRMYASQELVQKLVTKGFPREAALQAAERLLEVGLLDDRLYAEVREGEPFGLLLS